MTGPTGIGLVGLKDKATKGETENKYNVSFYASAQEIVPLLVEGELDIAIKNAFAVSSKILVEEKIDGVETEVGVLEIEGEAVSSVAGQLCHGGEFYSYDEKYKNGKTKYIIPAEIGEKTKKELEECLKKLYSALGTGGLCRFDFFVTSDGALVFNEVNTMPGFTHDSLFPMLWQYSGYSTAQILNIILNI